MKTPLLIVLCALIGSFSAGPWTTTASGAVDGTGLTERIARARQSNDLKDILAALRDVEKLWPQQPAEYFQCTASAAAALEQASGTNTAARQALLAMFDRVLQKPCRGEVKDAFACFDLKHTTVLACLQVVQSSGSKARLLALAQFAGEVRSRITPNYDSEASSLPPGLNAAGVQAKEPFAAGAAPDPAKDPAARAAHDRLMAEHERVLLTNQLQALLRRIDSSLTPRLLAICSQFRGADEAADFVGQISFAARLTEEERKKL